MLRKIKKIFKFLKRLWLYLPVIWNDCDYDYAAVITLIKFKLGHLREHIADHQMFIGWEEVVKEIKKAEMLIIKFSDEYPSEQADEVWKELFDHLKENMKKWWC